MENIITISIQAYGITHISNLPESCSATELIEICSQLVESIGFDSSLIVKALKEVIDSRI